MITIRALTWTALAALLSIFSPAVVQVQDASAKPTAQEAAALKDDKEKRSYAVGMNLGTAVRRQSADQSTDLDVNAILQGFKDAFAGGKTLLTEAEMRTILNALQADVKSKQAMQLSERSAKSESEGNAFLAENKTKEGVVSLPSGLQYKIVKAGDGKKPTITDAVVCHYRGTLVDGTEFDSSYKRGKPATFALAKVIKGWTEALQLMPVGSKWQLFIPSSLGYGTRGAGKNIPPNATLIFEVELISIQPSDAGKSTAAEGPMAGTVPAAISDSPGIKFSVKRDPRISKSLYTGDVWLPLPYSQVAADKTQVTVEARAEGRDASGRPTKASPTWIPSEPDMVTVTPAQGKDVKITALRPGESRLRVTCEGVTSELAVKASYKGEALVVEISQAPVQGS
jgi:FKBP-type peptidyl-prolyl cis-trans isomerase FklB